MTLKNFSNEEPTRVFNDKEIKTIRREAKSYIDKLIDGVLDQITSKEGYSTKKYRINISTGPYSFSEPKHRYVTLREDLKSFAKQKLLIAEFVKESPGLFGLSDMEATDFHAQITSGLFHSKFSDEFDKHLTLSVSSLQDKYKGKLDIKAPVKQKSGNETYTKIIHLTAKNLAPLRQVS